MTKELSHMMLELHNVRIKSSNVRKIKGTVKCEKKNKGTTKCDKSTIKSDVGTIQCDKSTIKFIVIIFFKSKKFGKFQTNCTVREMGFDRHRVKPFSLH